MRNLYIIMFFCVQTSVKSHQYEANKVYLQLSHKIDYEIGLLQQKHERELQNIKVDILNKIEAQINKKIDRKIESQINKKIDSKIEAQINEKIDNKIEAQINEKIDSKIEAQINEKIDSKIKAQINEKIDRKTESQINEKIDRKIESQINEKIDMKIESQINEKIDRKIESQINEKIDMKIESQINEKIDRKIESQINEKTDSVQTEIFSSQPGHYEAIRNTLQDRQPKTDHSENQKGTETNLEEIKDEVAIIKQAFKVEKKHVRTLQERTNSCTERLKAINDTILRHEEADTYHTERIKALSDKILRNGEADTHQSERIKALQNATWRNEEANTYLEENFRASIQALERQLQDLVATQGLFGEKQDMLEQEVDKLMDKQSSLDSKVGNNEDSLYQLVNKMERRKVAFSAYLSLPTDKLPIGSTVVFDGVIYQEGNGYNPKDGVFTCPETGVYMFSVVIDNGDLQNVTGKSVNVKLKVDSVTTAVVVSEEHHEYQDDQSSDLVILKVNKGQKVWVETFSKNDVIIWEDFSTFSGALLYN